jgi:CheY-like chemotaxis protein
MTQPLSILLVDDAKIPLVIYTAALKKKFEGVSVDTADGAEGALSLVATKPFHVIVTDLEMPNKNGLQLIRELRENLDSATTRIVLMSGVEEENKAAYAAKAQEAGADGFFSKKDQHAELGNLIESLLPPAA